MKLSVLFSALALLPRLATDVGAEEPAPTRHISARLMQMPAVSTDHLAFVYAGDIWIAPKTGGPAFRLSSPRGAESFPRFSPDGRELAFSGNYEEIRISSSCR